MLILIIERISKMDTNIVFKLSKDTITISAIKKEVDYKSLNNTNIIDLKELKFSTEYIRENFELVSSFLDVAIIKKILTMLKLAIWISPLFV